MKKLFLVLIFVLILFEGISQEVILYNQNQEPCLKVIENNWIESYQKEENLAYLIIENQEENIFKVFDKNGIEIGFFQDRILFDKYKKVLAAGEGAWKQKIAQVNYKGIKTILLDLDLFEWRNWKELLK